MAVLIMLIFCATAVVCVFICMCGDAISSWIDNTIVMIECTSEKRKLQEEILELRNEIERVKSEKSENKETLNEIREKYGLTPISASNRDDVPDEIPDFIRKQLVCKPLSKEDVIRILGDDNED